MKPIHTILSVLLCLIPLAAQSLSYEDYITEFAQAVRLKNEKGVDRILKKNTPHVLRHFQEIVRTEIARGEANLNSKQALFDSWKRVFDSETLQKAERWMQTLDREKWKSIDHSARQLVKGYGQKADLERQKSQDRKVYDTLIANATTLAQQFSVYGDVVNAAETWALIQQTYGKIPQQTLDDRREAVAAAERYLEERQKWDYTKDDYYKAYQNFVKGEKEKIKDEEKRASKRSSEGYGDDVKGAGAYLMPDADKSEIVVPLVFKVQKKPNRIDMSLQGGPVPMLWPVVSIKKTGPTKLPWFTRTGLYMVRPGSNKFGVTLNGSETNLKKNPFTKAFAASKLKTPTKFFLDENGKIPYALWFFVAGTQQPYQGMNQNLAPTKESATIYYKCAGSWTAEVDGVPITFYDDNSNGKLFEEDPFAYGYADRTIGSDSSEEVKLPVFDGMKIGKGTIQPFSSWVKVGESWMHLREQGGGLKLGVRKTNPEYLKSGTIQFVWKGSKSAKPSVLVVQGVGDFADARFNIADGKPMEVPVGKYELIFGRIVQGKGARMMTATIVGGKAEAITVEAGKVAKLTLGAPFKIDFKRGGTGVDVVVNSHRIKVYGVGGELYTHLNGAVAAADVMVAKDKTGKGAKSVASFIAITDADIANVVAKQDPNLRSYVGFYPVAKGDAKGTSKVKFKVKKGQVIGLSQKKNKMFGKLLPIWK